MILSDKIFRRIVATVDCDLCKGQGQRYIMKDYNQLELTSCEKCQGTGEVEKTQDFDITKNYNNLLAEIDFLKKEIRAKKYRQMFKKSKTE